MSKANNLEPCPKCGFEFVDIWKSLDTHKYSCECRKCHYVSRESRFLFLAKWRWNHEEIFETEEEFNEREYKN